MSASTGLTLATEVERHHQEGLAVKEEFSFYVGVDWGVEFHQACMLDAKGEKICQRRIEHSGPGMLELCDFLQALTNGKASALAVAIEVPRVPIVEALRQIAGDRSRAVLVARRSISGSAGLEPLLPVTPLWSKRKALNREADRKQSCGYFASAD
jgi:hypothetical protein